MAIATRSKDATRGAPGLTTRNKKLLEAKGIATNGAIGRSLYRLEPIATRVEPGDADVRVATASRNPQAIWMPRWWRNWLRAIRAGCT